MNNININNLYENYMKTDIFEKDNKYYLEIDLPGYNKKDIKINYNSSYLTIVANKEERKNIDKYLQKERTFGQTKRVFYIGEKNKKDIKALFSNGILYISFPKY